MATRRPHQHHRNRHLRRRHLQAQSPRRRRPHPAVLHPPQHRAALLRPHPPGVSPAFIRPLPARGPGRVHLRRPAHPHRQGRPDHAARHRSWRCPRPPSSSLLKSASASTLKPAFSLSITRQPSCPCNHPRSVRRRRHNQSQPPRRLDRPTRLRTFPPLPPQAATTEPILFSVTANPTSGSAFSIKAVAHTGDPTVPCSLIPDPCFSSGWQSIGYPGLRPYNLYKPAQLLTRKVDVKLAPNLHIGYVMGTGDLVPTAPRRPRHHPTPAHRRRAQFRRPLSLQRHRLLSASRAYSVRPRSNRRPAPS